MLPQSSLVVELYDAAACTRTLLPRSVSTLLTSKPNNKRSNHEELPNTEARNVVVGRLGEALLDRNAEREGRAQLTQIRPIH